MMADTMMKASDLPEKNKKRAVMDNTKAARKAVKAKKGILRDGYARP